MKSELPVTDEQDHLLGMITLKEILAVPENQRENAKSKYHVINKYLAVVLPEAEVEKAFMQMVKKRVGKIFVCIKTANYWGYKQN